jgi:hypothetical protein
MPYEDEWDEDDYPSWYSNRYRVSSCADSQRWEPPADSSFPTHVVYPVEHRVKCKGHRAYMSPSAANAVRDAARAAWVPSWVLYPNTHTNVVKVSDEYL